MGWGVSGNDIAVGSVGLAFDSRVSYMEHNVTKGSSPLRRFFETVLPKR